MTQRASRNRKIWRHRKKDGSIITVEIKANDYVSADRNIRLVLINDVTERERAREGLRKTEEQLRQAQKMDAIGQLAGGVAHDFNNVLTVIQSYAWVLEEAFEPSDARHEYVTEIIRATERGTGITRQLLTVSRHSLAAPQSISLDEIVARFVPMLRRLVGEEVAIATHSGNVPPVIADPGQIEQVLMNLAVNARDAMSGRGRLTIETLLVEVDSESADVRALQAGSHVVLAVSDTGAGMDLATQARIFEPFFTTKQVGKGTGLGLSIVHGIVTQSGGAISVHSDLGHGTTFRIHLASRRSRRAHRRGRAAPTIRVLGAARTRLKPSMISSPPDSTNSVSAESWPRCSRERASWRARRHRIDAVPT